MPLHLLGKKSWNVYNQENIARVRRDEADAAAREAAEEQAMQEVDAQRRMRILRGESVDGKDSDPSRLRSRSPAVEAETRQQPEAGRELGKDLTYGDLDRRRKRRRGEDDTDRDIRYARQMNSGSVDERRRRSGNEPLPRRISDDAPLHDQDGHIDLFPAERRKALQGRKRDDKLLERSGGRSEVKNKECPGKFDGTMRLSDAEGRHVGAESKPWYGSTRNFDGHGEDNERVGKDVWGNEDRGRLQRDKVRLAADDPLAAMMRGVKQVREVETDRKKWRSERAAEIESMIQDERRRARRKRHSDRREGLDRRDEDIDVEELRLDTNSRDGSSLQGKESRHRGRSAHDNGRRHRYRGHRKTSHDTSHART